MAEKNMAKTGSTSIMKLVCPVLLVVLIATAIYNEVRAVDFGFHWDEDRHLGQVADSYREGWIIPKHYEYPSMTYWLARSVAMVCGAPQVDESENAAWTNAPNSAGSRNGLADPYRSFRLSVRKLVIAISLLSAVWVYLMVAAWRSSRGEALLAAALLALSWEVNYHSRWIAPDTIMMQFGALTMMSVFYAYRSGKLFGKWLTVAAAAAGLAASTKYTGGILILSPLLAAAPGLLMRERRNAALRQFAVLVAAFGIAYLVVTPGTIVHARAFLRDISAQSRIYYSAWGGYTVGPGGQSLALSLSYILLVLPSKYPFVAAALSLFGMVGLVTIIRQDRWKAAVLLVPPIAYLGFMCTASVLIVRNLMVLAPFMAVLIARGCAAVAGWNRLLRTPTFIAVTALLAANLFWQFHSAGTIVQRKRVDIPKELLAYVRSHQSEQFVLSQRMASMVAPAWNKMPGNVVSCQTQHGTAVFMASEIFPWQLWRVNRLNCYSLLPSGPHEVNWDYYASWGGDDRAIMLPIKPEDPICHSLQIEP